MSSVSPLAGAHRPVVYALSRVWCERRLEKAASLTARVSIRRGALSDEVVACRLETSNSIVLKVNLVRRQGRHLVTLNRRRFAENMVLILGSVELHYLMCELSVFNDRQLITGYP